MIEYLAIAHMTKLAVSWEQKFAPDISEKPLKSPEPVSNFSGLAALAKKIPPVNATQKQAEITMDDIDLKQWLEKRRQARSHAAMRDMNIEARSLPNV